MLPVDLCKVDFFICSFCLDAKEPKDQDRDRFAKIQNKSLNIFETRALLFPNAYSNKKKFGLSLCSKLRILFLIF
jgi:hypothetical protein